MEPTIVPALAKTATSAVAKLLGGVIPNLAREAWRRRAVRRAVRTLSAREAPEPDWLAQRLDPADAAKMAAYVRLPDFEQLAIQLTGMTLERKRPEKHVADLRAGLRRSLELNGIAVGEDLADALFDELWSAVVASIGAVGQNSDAASALGTTMTVSVRAMAAARNCGLLERIHTLDDIQTFTRTVRAQIGRVERFIRPPHVESGRRVPLTSLFVEPRLSRNERSTTLQKEEWLSPREVLAGNLRTVVLGDPGGGKSTLAAMITSHIARSVETGLRGRVPFLLVMRDYAEYFQQGMSVPDFLEKLVSARYQLKPPRDWVEFVLLNGRAVIVFDGLDELLDTSLRGKAVEAVEAFSYAYPTTTVLVTSRRIGYDQASLDDGLFTKFGLSDFDEIQVRTYVGKWFALDPDLGEDESKQLARAFMRESQNVPDLRNNPLMLALMCALYRGEGYIPRNKLDVYERCAALIFERWDRRRGVNVLLPFEQHVRPALYAMAEWMFTRNNQDAVTERALVNAVRRYLLKKRFEDLDEAEATAEAFVDYCRGRAWVLTEVGTTGAGEGLFAFTHRTFLEFYTANHLVRTNTGAKALLGILLPHLDREEWDVVAELAVLLLDRYVENGADRFVNLLIAETENRPPDERVAPLVFAARLLSNFVPSPPNRRRLFNACWDLASSLDGDAPRMNVRPWNRLNPLAWLLTAAEENREPIASMIRSRVANGQLAGLSAALAVTMDQVIIAVADNRLLAENMREFWYRESMNNRAALREFLVTEAAEHTWAAVEAAFHGDLSIGELIEKHGAAAVCEAPPIWGTSYRRVPILQQEVLLNNGDDWLRGDTWASLAPRTGEWTDELAAALPLAPTPWARLSRLPWWDMSVESLADMKPPGTARFELTVMCACVQWEARAILQNSAHEIAATIASPLPSWLAFPMRHPAWVVIKSAADARYGQGSASLEAVPREWLSPPVRTLVERWASSEVDLVEMDSGQYAPD